MPLEFTQRGLGRLVPSAKVRNVSDPKTPGLVFRMTPTGSRSYFYTYRMGGRGTLKCWIKIGDFTSIQLNQAQTKAREYRSQVDLGVDPRQSLLEAANKGETIATLSKRFLNEHGAKQSKSTQQGYRLNLDTHILPKLGRIPVRDLTREQVQAWHAGIEGKIIANRALALLSKMLTLADLWRVRTDGVNPCRHIERNTETPRTRDVSMKELNAIGEAIRALEGERSPWALAAIRTIILCWGRVSEVLSLRRGPDVLLDEGYAMIRDHKTKRKVGAKRMELSPPVVKALRTLPQDGDNPHFFVGRANGSHLTRDGLHKVWVVVRDKAGIPDLRLNDFRSLGASEAEAQGINPKTAAALLGHSDERTTMKHYTRVRKAQEAAAKVAAPIAAALDGQRRKRTPQ
jgi:integrase